MNPMYVAGGNIICGGAGVGITIGHIVEDIRKYQKNKDLVELSVNTSIVIGSTVIFGVIGNGMVGLIGMGYGMLSGNLLGTWFKEKNFFGFF